MEWHYINFLMAVVYALWLLAGTADFHLHRRTDLPHTSGLRESALHAVQLVVIGGSLLAWLALAPTLGLVLVLSGAVLVHAVAGYWDTVSADGRRRISPVEQHVHSVLDVAPWVFLVWIAFQVQPGWGLVWQPAPGWLWGAVAVPAVLVVVMPWAYEFWRCLRAR